MTPSVSAEYDRRWLTLLVCCVVLFIVAVDNSVLNLALPSISQSLGATAGQLQWVVDAYTLVSAALLITTGALGDRYGRKRMLHLGLALFGLGSLGAALAVSTDMLILFRSVLGLAAAMVMPSTLSILTNVFHDHKERAQAIAIWSSIFTIGAGIGPLVGGYLLSHFSWSSVFYVNLPVVAIGLLGGRLFVPESRDDSAPKADVPGALLSIGGLVSLVYGIIRSGEDGWLANDVLTWLGVAILLLATFAWWESRSAHPMLPLEFFKNMSFTGSSVALTISSFGLMGSLYFLSQYFQSVQGYTPLVAALCMLPMTPMGFVATLMSVKVDRKLGAKLTVSLGLFIAGAGLLALSMTAGIDTPYLMTFGVLLILSTGLGMIMSPATNAVMSSLPLGRAGIGAAMNDTTRQIGGTFGVAVLGALMNAIYRAGVDRIAVTNALPEGISELIRGSIQSAQQAVAQLPAGMAEGIVTGARQAFVDGMSQSVLIGAIIMFVAGIAALLMLPARVRTGREEMDAMIDPEPQATRQAA
jgi:EmrB/QacA subfamily drug resistance transporter